MLNSVSTQTSNDIIIIINDEAKYEQLLQHFLCEMSDFHENCTYHTGAN